MNDKMKESTNITNEWDQNEKRAKEEVKQRMNEKVKEKMHEKKREKIKQIQKLNNENKRYRKKTTIKNEWNSERKKKE